MSLTTHVAIHSAAIHTSSGDGSSSDLGPIMSLVVLALMILPLAIVAFTFFEVKTDFAASRLLRQMLPHLRHVRPENRPSAVGEDLRF